MAVPAASAAPGQRLSPGPGPVLQGAPGDTLIIDGADLSGVPRTGTIIAAVGLDGRASFLVRWTSGDYESRISPGPGARVEKHRT